jgi:carbon-monoxide dehydrogenase medium subunit
MFDYHEPAMIEDAVALLAARDDARCLAGGLTLVAMMNTGLLRPARVVSLRRIEDLSGIRPDGHGGLRIGAMTPHRVVAADDRLVGANAVVRLAAASIGVPIRNVGTIGGAVCHADPASDINTALVAAGAIAEIAGPGGRRESAVEDLFAHYLTTTLAADEVVTAIRLPRPAADSVGAHDKVCRVHGDTPTILAAVTLEFDGDTVSGARLAIGAFGAVPLRDPAAEAALVGTAADDAAVDRACAILAEKGDPPHDLRGSAQFRRLLLPRVCRRLIRRALEQPRPAA